MEAAYSFKVAHMQYSVQEKPPTGKHGPLVLARGRVHTPAWVIQMENLHILLSQSCEG